MHEDIRKFSLAGDMADTNIVQTKERLLNFVETVMRDNGYVPALDIEPQFTLDYSEGAESFRFTLSYYGVAVDKEKVWDTGGMMNGKPIPKYTPQRK